MSVSVPTEDGEEREKVKRAGECCKKILNHVNQAVKEAENKQVHAAEAVRRQVAWIYPDDLLCPLSTETHRVSEAVGHLVTQTEREPHDPGAEGGRPLMYYTPVCL